jgi:hypothetical protein
MKSTKSIPPSSVSNPSFEVLQFTYGKASNISSFKESSFNYCSRQVGPVARVIKEGTIFRPPPISRPTDLEAFSEAKDPFGDLKHHFNHQISERCKIMSQLPEKEFKLFHLIWANCSKESQFKSYPFASNQSANTVY